MEGGKSILIAEDDETLVNTLRYNFTGEGYSSYNVVIAPLG